MTRMSLEDARGLLPPGPWHWEAGQLLDAKGEVICFCAALRGRALERIPEMLGSPVVAQVALPSRASVKKTKRTE